MGLSEEETAHLRLLLRRASAELAGTWSWGEEASADLLVVNPADFGGEMAWNRARAGGRRCAVVADRPVMGADLLLRRPFSLQGLVSALRKAGASAAAGPPVQPQDHDFYAFGPGDAGAATPAGEPPAEGLDALLRHEPVELRGRGGRPVDPLPPATAGAPVRPAAPAEPRAAAPRYATREAMLEDTRPHPLRSWLETDALQGPVRARRDGLPDLVLDPKFRLAHFPGPLSAVQPWLGVRVARRDWQPVTSTELLDIRGAAPGRPYTHLLWLDALVAADGRLAPHLHPGGTYRLRQWTGVERELGRYMRIASGMLQPRRLHEIAAHSGVGMAEVFAFVSASESVGLIEWTPPPARAPLPQKGLFARLLRR